ncbi:CAAX protease [Trichothermofontia sp.]
MNPGVKRFYKWLLVAIGVGVAIVLLPPVQRLIALGYAALSLQVRLILDLVRMGMIAFLFAALLAPLEALGWWAGWYGQPVETIAERVPNPPQAIDQERAIAPSSTYSRYLIYLDGIGQGSAQQYLPDVEDFLAALAAALPPDICLVRDVMSYSVTNQPLTSAQRPLAFFWQLAEWLRLKKPQSLLGYVINIRNVLQVSVSADQRYGPIYNLGIAQHLYDSLIRQGYVPGSGIPVTLIGYSGGGQVAAGTAAFLKQAIQAPIELISLSGVMSGNNRYLQLEHLYHLAGEKDNVQRLSPRMFPGRRSLFFLSYWNRARRAGKITIVPLSGVGHNVPGGLLDPNLVLPDGRTALQRTIDYILDILAGRLELPHTATAAVDLGLARPSNYAIYQQLPYNRHDFYPLRQSPPSKTFLPVGTWIGRLILPRKSERSQVQGVWFEVYQADAEHSHWQGQRVRLCWEDLPALRQWRQAVMRDVYLSEQTQESMQQGRIHPDRLQGWRRVDPLESLAAAHPEDDVIVKLAGPVRVMAADEYLDPETAYPTLFITQEPVQITGRFYGLVQIGAPVAKGSDCFAVRHFNRESRQFDGPAATVRIPQVLPSNEGVFSSSNRGLEQSILNESGWYVYGAQDREGEFVVQAIAPRALLRLQPDQVVLGEPAAIQYLTKRCWQGTAQQKGQIKSVLLAPGAASISSAIAQWREGDRALLMHVYGGIGGKKKESAPFGLYFGHFAYGVAKVVRDPLSGDLRFEMTYKQIYTQNSDGIISGSLDWSAYMGDRQRGWLGVRPVADVLIRFPALTATYDFDEGQVQFSGRDATRTPLNGLRYDLEAMAARYRVGDGTGGTFVGPTNSCVQDASQALYLALHRMQILMQTNTQIQSWLAAHPDHPQTQQVQQLVQLEKALSQKLIPMGIVRSDWADQAPLLGADLWEDPFNTLYNALLSWRTLLPRSTFEAIGKAFLQQGASLWLLRSNQMGGIDPDIAPIAPTAFWW